MECPKCRAKNPETQRFCGECGTQLVPVGPDPRSDRPSDGPPAIPTKTMEAPIEELTTGSLFAERYQIVTELGKGGMGRVYRAIDKKINEEIALKLIKPEISADKKTIERFGNELKMARRIAHRNVCKMYYLGEEKGAHYITMEYVPGEDLKSMIRMSGQLSVGMALRVARQVCDGLTEAHRLGVVHRDLKPNNIMIDKDGEARIMDFGIARLLRAKGITGAGVMIGTPEYMSPEQVEGKDVDQRSDIYSLGVILYEMVTGQIPFEGDTPFVIGMKHKGETPRSPKEINSQISDDLNSLIMKCLTKANEERYQSAGEVRSELERIEKGLPTTEKIIPKKKPLTSREITVQFNLRKLLIPAVILFAVVVAAVIIWQLIPQREDLLAPKIENSIAVISFENQTGDQGYDYLQKAIPNLLISDLEQTGELYVATWERMHDLLKQMGRRDVEIIDRDLGFQICRMEGIESIVLGSFVKAGDTFVTDVKVLDVETKRLLKSANSRGKGEDSILDNQINELGREISLGLGIARQKLEASQRNIAELTTSSMEAYKYFLDGKDDIDNLYAEGARRSLEKAVELDPQFAMAYLYLGNAYGELGDRAARDEAYKKAKNHSAKATEKERFYIDARYANSIERDTEKRLRIYKELAEKYPKEKEAYYELGFYYQNRGMFEEAIEEFQRALQLDPNMGHVLNQLGYTYSDMGDYERAIYYFKRYAEANPEDANPIDSMAEQYFRMGQLDEAIEKYKEALDVQPEFGTEYRIAYIYGLKEDYPETMRWLDWFIGRAPSAGLKAEGYFWKGIFDFLLGKRKDAFVELSQAGDWADKAGNVVRKLSLDYTRGWMFYDLGEFERSREYLQKAWDVLLGLSPESKSWRAGYNFCMGLVEVKEKNMDSAQSRLDKIRSILPELETPSAEKERKAEHDWLYSEILLAKGSLAEAIEIFENIVYPPLPNMRTDSIGPYIMPFIQDTLARIYYQNGNLDKAIAEYERMITFAPKSSDRHLIHPKCHYLLAKLYEEKGLVAKAIEQYEIFLDLWKNADTGQPELEDAKKRLTSLQSR